MSQADPHAVTPYLNDLSELTIHGSIDCSGHLILIPIFSGIGSKGAVVYAKVCQTLMASRAFKDLVSTSGLFAGKANQTDVRFNYPALTTSLPLPGPAAIDAVLSRMNETPHLLTAARRQLERARSGAKLRLFNGLGTVCSDVPKVLAALRRLAEAHPGILSPPLEALLAAVTVLSDAAAAAEREERLTVVSSHEIAVMLDLPAVLSAPPMHYLAKPSWGGFYQELLDQDAALALALGDATQRWREVMDLAQIRKRTKLLSQQWCLLPDLGQDAYHAFISQSYRAIGSYQVVQTALPPRTNLARQERPGFGLDQSPLSESRHLLRRHADLWSFAWQATVLHAASAAFYPQAAATLKDLLPAWGRRSEPDSSLATLWQFQPSRPIAAGGALLVQHEFAPNLPAGVRLTPAVPRPEAAAQKGAAKRKKTVPQTRLWLKLQDLPSADVADARLTASQLATDVTAKPHWPLAKLWQSIDMVKTLAARPDLLLCPEVLTQGFITVAAGDWEARKGGAVEKVQVESAKPWPTVHAWFIGATSCPIAAAEANRRLPFTDTSSNHWPLSIIDGGAGTTDVRLSVRYLPATGDADLQEQRQLLQLLESLRGSKGSSRELQAAFEELGANLRFEARPYFEVDGEVIDEATWFAATKAGSQYMRLPNGTMLAAALYESKTEQFILRQRVYAKFNQVSFHQIWQVHRQATEASLKNLAPEEYLQQLSLKVAPVLKRLDEQLLAPVAAMLMDGLLRHLQSILRGYQRDGIAWCYTRLQLGLGVCLADEMGLGKTLQAMALLCAFKTAGTPSLVVVPKTLLVNWQRELARFAPGLSWRVVGESPPEQAADVWLTTYPRLRLAIDQLKEQEFRLIVLDEAQAIKNTDSQTTEAAGLLRSRYRLALTGTPVENHAGELWSLINWLNPGYLGRSHDFVAYTKAARSSEQKRLLLAPLRECLDPLLLRRTKADPAVQLGLPAKVHQDTACALTSEQQALYEALLEVILAEEVSGLTAFARRALFLKAILHCKQICIHPDLFYGDEEGLDAALESAAPAAAAAGIKNQVRSQLRKQSLKAQASGEQGWIGRSGKLSALADLFADLKEQSRGILLFTQYRAAAAMAQRVLRSVYTGDDVTATIHGGLSSPQRQQIVDDFNDACRRQRPEAPVLILSLKAGGTGLNLTGADRVIHLDRWWNPAVEDQATDRAHRLGQDRTVFVHTISTAGTIEEAIARLFIDKRQLAEDLLGGVEAAGVGSLLASRDGFLGLVDPQQLFSKRLATAPVFSPRPRKG